MEKSLTEKNQLLDKVEELNRTLENSYMGLALLLVQVEETSAFREAGYDTFPDYYREELGREKSTVSRLLQVGRWLRDNSLVAPGNLSYKKLEAAIRAYPHKEPKYVLAAAKTLTLSDFKEEKKEDGHTHEYHEFCKFCWKRNTP